MAPYGDDSTDDGTSDVSDTAEQGSPAEPDTATDEVTAGEESAAVESDEDETQKTGYVDADAEDSRPVWNVETHGPARADIADRYRVINDG